jgi:hypothetical protein
MAYAAITDGYERRVEKNFEIPDNAATPVHGTTYLASLGYKESWKDIDAGTTVLASKQSYGNVLSTAGAILDQEYRDESDLKLDSYVNVHLWGRFTSSLSLETWNAEISARARNFTEWRVSDTLTANLTSKTSIGFLVGVAQQNYYNNPLLASPLLPQYEAQGMWSPTRTLSFRAAAGYRDTGIDYVAGINAGAFASYCTLDAVYLIWRDLQLKAGLKFEERHLADDQDLQREWDYRVAVNYELNSFSGLSFLYTSQQWDSKVPSNNLNEKIFQSSFNVRF